MPANKQKKFALNDRKDYFDCHTKNPDMLLCDGVNSVSDDRPVNNQCQNFTSPNIKEMTENNFKIIKLKNKCFNAKEISNNNGIHLIDSVITTEAQKESSLFDIFGKRNDKFFKKFCNSNLQLYFNQNNQASLGHVKVTLRNRF